MRMSYCDLCGAPVRDTRYFMLIVKGTSDDSYAIPKINNLYDVDRKEICGNCKKILDRLFVGKLQALKDINKEIERLFRLSS